MMSESREQFEAYVRKNSPGNFDFRRCGYVYSDPSTQDNWELWQASRLYLLRQIRALDALVDAGLKAKS